MPPLNQNWQTFGGEPVTGIVPAQIILDGPAMTPQQQGAVYHAFKLFCDAVRVSSFPDGYHVQHRTYPDGMTLRMESNGGRARAIVNTVAARSAQNITKIYFTVSVPHYYGGSYRTSTRQAIEFDFSTKQFRAITPVVAAYLFHNEWHVSGGKVIRQGYSLDTPPLTASHTLSVAGFSGPPVYPNVGSLPLTVETLVYGRIMEGGLFIGDTQVEEVKNSSTVSLESFEEVAYPFSVWRTAANEEVTGPPVIKSGTRPTATLDRGGAYDYTMQGAPGSVICHGRYVDPYAPLMYKRLVVKAGKITSSSDYSLIVGGYHPVPGAVYSEAEATQFAVEGRWDPAAAFVRGGYVLETATGADYYRYGEAGAAFSSPPVKTDPSFSMPGTSGLMDVGNGRASGSNNFGRLYYPLRLWVDWGCISLTTNTLCWRTFDNPGVLHTAGVPAEFLLNGFAGDLRIGVDSLTT